MLTIASWPAYRFLRRQVSSAQSLSRVRPHELQHQASLSIINAWSLPKVMSIQLVMPCNHLILCCPFLLPPSVFPSIRVFSSKSFLRIRWPTYWSFSVSPSNEYSELIAFRITGQSLIGVCCLAAVFFTTEAPGKPQKKWCTQTYLQNRHRLSDLKNELMFARVEEWGKK